ncbi:transposase [uncultured Paludibaculum sp.]|uniref:transposase n=1 Tax=uncultured Paludibaculum sp. TaxID=1765020 RepID=UPI002AABA4CF|nr:transposase [uncultured Paludibaculum sp.]
MAVLLTWSGFALHPTIHEDQALVRWRVKRAKSQPFTLEAPHRKLVMETIRTYCGKRDWLILALHIRPTHIHLVLDTHADPARAVGAVKSACTAALRAARLAGPNDRIWADYRNIRNLKTPLSIAAAVYYVLNQQGSPMEVYPQPAEPLVGDSEP